MNLATLLCQPSINRRSQQSSCNFIGRINDKPKLEDTNNLFPVKIWPSIQTNQITIELVSCITIYYLAIKQKLDNFIKTWMPSSDKFLQLLRTARRTVYIATWCACQDSCWYGRGKFLPFSLSVVGGSICLPLVENRMFKIPIDGALVTLHKFRYTIEQYPEQNDEENYYQAAKDPGQYNQIIPVKLEHFAS